MNFDWWTFGLQTVNFLVLVWVLHRFLYKPVLARIDARKEKIADELADAEHHKQQAAALESEAADARRQLERQRDEELSAAHAQSEQERQRILDEAHQEARHLKQAARDELDEERREVLDHLHQRAAELAADLSRRLLAEVDCASATTAMLARLDEEIDELDDAQLSLMRQAAANDGHATVRSARPLDDASQSTWAARIDQVCDRRVDTEFVVDPALIEGAQIELPGGAQLAYHWKHVLEQARRELHDDE